MTNEAGQDYAVRLHVVVRVHARDEQEAARLAENSTYHWHDWRLDDDPAAGAVVLGVRPKGEPL